MADPEQQAAIDRALAEWRQGDCVRADPARPPRAFAAVALETADSE